jgi:hypothetical protein
VSGVSFEDLVAVAALGVSRKGFADAELDGPAARYAGVLDAGDPAAALLDAAALLTVASRAGVRPLRAGRDGGHDEPAGGADGLGSQSGGERELSARGARLLVRLGRLDRPRGAPVRGNDLLGDLLVAMRDARCVLPAPLLPSLLDLAARSAALRPLVAAVLGPRGAWLAGHRADWREVADAGPARASGTEESAGPVTADRMSGSRYGTAGGRADAAEGPSTDGPGSGDGATGAVGDAGGPEVWRVGGPGERLAFLTGLRERDPGAARELLAAGWPRESGSERARLLGALGHGLAAGDEEFLEHALDDRAAEVSRVARQLLARLPGSDFRRRAARRAAAVLRLEGEGPDARLVGHRPDAADKAAVRDGIEPRSPAHWVDDTAWRFSQVIAGVPPTYWTARFGMTPAQIVALPVRDVAAIEVRAGWRLAAARQAAPPPTTGPPTTGQPRAERPGAERQAQRSADGTEPWAQPDDTEAELADWALALLDADLGPVNRPPSAWVLDAALAALLPAGLRAARAAALLDQASTDASHPRARVAMTELAGHPVPWPAMLADAVLRVMAREILRPKLTVLSQAFVETAGRGLPASGDKDYAAELMRLADSMPQSWVPEMIAAAETIALRRAFLTELR